MSHTGMKMRAVILLVFVGFATSLPLASDQHDIALLVENLQNPEAKNGPVETIILGLLETLRALMVNGLFPFVPVLDPLNVPRVHLDQGILQVPNSYLTMNDLRVRGLSTFEVEQLQFSIPSIWPQRFRLDFDIVIPNIDLTTSNYNLYIPLNGGQFYGQGKIDLQVVKPRLKGFIEFGIRPTLFGTYLTVTDCKISIDLEAFDPTITGILNDQVTSDFASAFLKNLIENIIKDYQEDITDYLSDIVKTTLNDFLYDFDIGNLLPLFGESKNQLLN